MKEDLKNVIKRTAENHSDDINPDMIWAGIESKMGDKKKRRFGGYWIFGGLSIFIAVLISIFVWSSEDLMNQSSIVNYVIDNKINEEVLVENEVLNENVILVDEKDDHIELNNEENTISVEHKVIANGIKSTTKNENLFDENNARKVQELSLKSDELEEDIFFVYSNNNLTVVDEVKGNSKLMALNVNGSRKLLSVAKTKFLKLDKFNVEDRSVGIENFEEFVFDSPYTRGENKFSFLSGIELYTGLSFGDKSVNDVDQSYADERNASEELLEQWSAGLRFDLVKVMDFQLHSGIRYSMITDRMRTINEYMNHSEYTYSRSRLVDGEIIVIDSMVAVVDTMNQTFAYTTEQYNSQRIVSIPLEVSFGKSFNRFDLGIGFGVNVNYQLTDTHVILGQDGKASVNKVGGKWVSPSFSGSLLAGYKLNEDWSITSRLNFSGLTLADHESISTLKSNYKLYGIEFGVKMNFGK